MPRRRIVFPIAVVVALFLSQIGLTEAVPAPVPGDSRPSIVYRPANLPMTASAPLVVLLHGSRATPESLISWSRFNRLADARGFVVASLASQSNQTWMSAEWMNSEADVDYMRSELQLLERTQNIDPARVFVIGFSSGGSMAYRAACELADQIAGIGVVSSSFAMTHSCAPSRPVSVMGIFGTTDGVIPFNGTTRVEAPAASIARWRKFDSCPEAPEASGSGVVSTQTWQPCAMGTAVAYTVIEGGKHTWSGAGGLPESSPNAQLDATGALWTFLSAHPMQAVAPVAPKVDAAIRSVSLRRVGKKTDLTVALDLGEKVRGTLTLAGGGRTVKTRKVSLTRTGRVSLVTHVGRVLAAGRYTVKLNLTDAQGAQLMRSRNVTMRGF